MPSAWECAPSSGTSLFAGLKPWPQSRWVPLPYRGVGLKLDHLSIMQRCWQEEMLAGRDAGRKRCWQEEMLAGRDAGRKRCWEEGGRPSVVDRKAYEANEIAGSCRPPGCKVDGTMMNRWQKRERIRTYSVGGKPNILIVGGLEKNEKIKNNPRCLEVPRGCPMVIADGTDWGNGWW
jgi:hypothetical protein